MELKLRKRRKAYTTLTTKEAAEIVANNKIIWKPIIKRHELNRKCPKCGSGDTLFNSNRSRKCVNCSKIFYI